MMALGKRKFIALLIILSPILVFLGGFGSNDFAKAYPGQVEISGSPPTMWILSPTRNTNYTDEVPLIFAVDTYGTNGLDLYSTQNGFFWDVTGFRYFLDGQPPVAISGNTTIVGLTKGTHMVTVKAVYEIVTFAWPISTLFSSQSVTFTVNPIPPNISNVSIEDKSYNVTSLPLSFTVDKNTSWIGYGLDNRANATTFLGNTTLTALTNGSHSLVIYANDTFGNMGKSEMVNFTISLPTPSPHISPSSWPTQSPTPSPSPNQTTTWTFPPELILVTVLAVLVGIAGLILWLGKR